MDKNDYPWVSMYYSVKKKELSVIIEWSSCEFTDTIGVLNIDLHQNASQIQWKLEVNNIEKFKLACQHDEALLNRLEESIDLIPKNNALVTS